VSDVFQPEQVVSGRYRVLRKIGGGGMADVYLCEDLTLGRRVALKVLLSRFLDDPNFVERFRREAKAAAGLNHANLVSIYDWGEVDGTYFIVMEYVEGETLKDLVRRRGRLGGSEAVHISLQLLAALEFAHRTGIVHRDIKPQNVMLDRDGNAKVTDFGIARAADSGMTEAGSILGTAQYLAPEQARGQRVDERSDLYSVGIVLYEMLTGTVPFKGDSAVTVALKHVNEMAAEPAQLVPGMPYALNQIVLKAIAKDPDQRYQTAEQFARDLRSAQAGGPVAAATFDPGAEATRLMSAGVVAGAGATSVMAGGPLAQTTGDRGRKRRRWPWVLLIVLLVLVIAATAYGLMRAMGAGGVAVPTVVGKSEAAAVTKLKEAGFEAVVQEEYSDKYEQGFVSRRRHKPAQGRQRRHLGEQGQRDGDARGLQGLDARGGAGLARPE
jgi:predicted Ser/Thr protein kinase